MKNCLHKTPPKGGPQRPSSTALNPEEPNTTDLQQFSKWKVGLLAGGSLRSLPRLAALVSPISVLCQSCCHMKETVWFSGPRKSSVRLGASAVTLSPQSFPFITLCLLWIFSLHMWGKRKPTHFPRLDYKKEEERIIEHFVNTLHITTK